MSQVAAAAPGDDSDSDPITELLEELSRGNREAEARLFPQVNRELRRLAAYYMRRERPDHTLQPTALVNEAFLRLAKQHPVSWQGRAHFFATAAKIMRRILIDYAKNRGAAKREGGRRVTFIEGIASSEDRTFEVIRIHEAMERLEQMNPRQSRLVELRFFGGLSFEEIALVLQVSERTVKRDWAVARAWLHSQLKS